jgi:hypothetical protein
MDYATGLAGQVVDSAHAAFAALWPRSIEAREIGRLVLDGCQPDSICDVEFSLSFDDPGVTGAAMRAVRAAGFVITDESSTSRGFVVVRLSMRLRPWDLSRTTSRLNRLIEPYGGFAAFIGPVETAEPVEAGGPDPRPSGSWYRAAS